MQCVLCRCRLVKHWREWSTGAEVDHVCKTPSRDLPGYGSTRLFYWLGRSRRLHPRPLLGEPHPIVMFGLPYCVWSAASPPHHPSSLLKRTAIPADQRTRLAAAARCDCNLDSKKFVSEFDDRPESAEPQKVKDCRMRRLVPSPVGELWRSKRSALESIRLHLVSFVVACSKGAEDEPGGVGSGKSSQLGPRFHRSQPPKLFIYRA